MKSIESGIRKGMLISLISCFLLLALIADFGVKQLSHQFIATRLEHDADNLIKALTQASSNEWVVDAQILPLVYQRVNSGHYYQVAIGEQKIRSRSLWEQQPYITRIATGVNKLSLVHSQDEHWLVWQQGIEKNNQTITLWVAEDIAPFERIWQKFTMALFLVMAVTSVLMLWIQRRLIRKGFSSIDMLSNDIRQLKHGHISQLERTPPAEVQPLTAEINQLLDRLEQRTTRSRTAIGNLAHEQKRLLQGLSLLEEELPASNKEEFQQILIELQRLSDREMKRARIAGSSRPGRHFDAKKELPVIVNLLNRLYPAKSIDLKINVTGQVPLDRDDMLELIGNLADNACKYGDKYVRIEISKTDDAVKISVANDGKAVPESLIQSIMERGTRVDESQDGFGLGLSICKMIADSYLGSIVILSEPQCPSGYKTEFIVSLPI